MDCKPINIVEDQGLQGIVQITSGDPPDMPPLRGTIVAIIQKLCRSEKAKEAEELAQATCIELTGDQCKQP